MLLLLLVAVVVVAVAAVVVVVVDRRQRYWMKKKWAVVVVPRAKYAQYGDKENVSYLFDLSGLESQLCTYSRNPLSRGDKPVKEVFLLCIVFKNKINSFVFFYHD